MVRALLFRIALACGLMALLAALIVIPAALGFTVLGGLHDSAEQLLLIGGLAFMWAGFVLLVAAIVSLSRAWSELSNVTKIVSVFGLLAGTFAAAYMFHWLFPKTPGEKSRG